MNKDYFLYVWHNATPSVVFFLLSSVFSHLLWLLPPDLCMTCVDWNDDAWRSLQNSNTSNVVGVIDSDPRITLMELPGKSEESRVAVLKLCTLFVRCVKLLLKNNYHPKKKSRTWEWDGTGIIFLAWRQDRSIFVGIGKNISENSHPQKWNIHAHTYTVYTCTHPHFMAGSICLATIQQLFFSSC